MKQPFVFNPSNEALIKQMMSRYPQGKQKSALIPILHLAQEQNSYLSDEAMNEVARILNIKPIEVYEVATFYSMFHLTPVGEYVFEICRTGPCMLKGSDEIIQYVQKKLNIKINETTADKKFTLKVVECLGACGYAPVMQVGKHYKEFLTKEKIDHIIDTYIHHHTN